MEDITAPGIHLYQGTPREIVVKISTGLGDLLGANAIAPNALTALSLIHVAGAIVRAMNLNPLVSEGIPPSFGMLLTCLRRGFSGGAWTEEEVKEFDKEFCKIIESLGGGKIDRNAAPPFIAPMSSSTH